jgi:PAS domain-containing protein
VQTNQNVDCSPVELKNAEGLFDLQVTALKATANAVVITDLNGTVVWVNSAFEKLTGFSAAEVLGNPNTFQLGYK